MRAREADRDKNKAYMAAYYVANRERMKAQSQAWAAAHPEQRARARRAHYLKAKFGLSSDQYDAIHAAQNGVCAICFQPEVGKRLAVDHCHQTGEVRGLLCQRCNRAVGLIDDEAERAASMARYLGAR